MKFQKGHKIWLGRKHTKESIEKTRIGKFKNNPPLKRFWSKILILDNGCWQWKKLSIEKGQYAKILINGKILIAHRWIFEQFIKLIPKGLTLDHLCRNRGCVNPWHLEIVTLKENILRGFGSAAFNARKQFCKWGHSLEKVYQYNGKRQCRICNCIRSKKCYEKFKAKRVSLPEQP